MQTYGDIYRIKCPVCEDEITNLWELGDIQPGDKINCSSCGSNLEITDVDVTVNLTLEPYLEEKKHEEL